jgi:LPXTG-motif cell wall-anchored protein
MRKKALILGTALLLGSMAASTVQAQVDDPALGGAGTTTGSGGFDAGTGGTGDVDNTGSGGMGVEGDGYLPATGGDPLSAVAAGAALSSVGFALLRRRRAK